MVSSLTYKKSGVNIDEANKFVKGISGMVRSTYDARVLGNLGGFGGCFLLGKNKYKNPVLVSSTDGVGTKLKIAMLADKHDTVGIDLVAMNVNDVLAMGAQPIFFLDYVAVGKVDRKKLTSIISGIVKGCKDSGCALIGGETAEMPVIYKKDEYDLAGFCVGIVEKEKVITGAGIRPKDVLIGIESSGLHSNGFSLVHRIFSEKELKLRAKELLTPTRIYVRPVLSLREKCDIKGIAHITGGAFYEKLMRIFPKDCSVLVKKGSWQVPEIFSLIQKRGNVKREEMFRTFNMGIGMVLVIRKNDIQKARKHLQDFRLRSWVIGEVSRGKSRLEFIEE